MSSVTKKSGAHKFEGIPNIPGGRQRVERKAHIIFEGAHIKRKTQPY